MRPGVSAWVAMLALSGILSVATAGPAAAAPQGAGAPASATLAGGGVGRWKPADGSRIEFDVLRNGQPFGRHVVAFRRKGDTLNVETDIDLKVMIGPLTVYHYVHDATETWIGGALERVEARTKKDGRWREVAAKAVQGGLDVAGSAFRGVLNKPVIPSTHWNIEQMSEPAMLSTETGEMLKMTVVDKGLETVRIGSGEIQARRYLVKSDLDAEFWYDARGRWVKCAFTAEGSRVEYVLRELPA